MALGIEDGSWLLLEGKVDVEEGSESVYRHAMLRVVEEISLTTLVAGIPFENVEMGILRTVRCS